MTCQILGQHSGPVAFDAFWTGFLCERHLSVLHNNRALVADGAQVPLFGAGRQLVLL